MSEVRNGDQKVQKCLISEIFYGRREVHKYLSYREIFLYFCKMVGSRIHYSSFASYVMCHYYIKKSYGPTERGIVT